MDVKAAPNGVATIEDRILRITGYYGYYPGYSSQKSTTRSSVTRCKPGPNCPSSHSSISRQLSPLSVTEDSSAPILELQSRGSSGVCGRRVERQSRSGDDGTQTRPESSSQENGLKARCLYLLALKKLTATDVSALFCCNKAFVFLLSWIVLKDRFMGVRVMAHLIPCAVPPCFLNLSIIPAI